MKEPLMKVMELDQPMLMIMSGVPGSGKSTLVELIKSQQQTFGIYNLHVVSPDAIRIERNGSLLNTPRTKEENAAVFSEAHRRIKQHLKNKEDVVFDATNLTVKYRSDLYNTYKNSAFVIVAQTDVELYELLQRNTFRPEDERVPEDVIKDMFAKLEAPKIGEDCHATIDEFDVGILLDKAIGGKQGEDGVDRVDFDNLIFVADEKTGDKKVKYVPKKDVEVATLPYNGEKPKVVPLPFRGDTLVNVMPLGEKEVENMNENIRNAKSNSESLNISSLAVGSLLILRNGTQLVITNFSDSVGNSHAVLLNNDAMVDELDTVLLSSLIKDNGRGLDRLLDVISVYDPVDSNNFYKYYQEIFDDSFRVNSWNGNAIPLITDFEYQVLCALRPRYFEYEMTGDGNDVYLVNEYNETLPFGFEALFEDFAHTLEGVTVQDLIDEYERVNK